MKKRLLSLVLCLVMVFSLLPMASFAEVHPVDGNVHALDVVFKNGNDTISTQSVFKETGTDLPSDAIYDPGCPLESGTMFLGWQIAGTSDFVTIEQILDYVNQHNSGVTVNAVTSAVHYLVYKDENNRVLKTDTVAQTEHPDWKVEVDYDYVPAVANQDHVGWTKTQGGDTVQFYNGEQITVSDARVELYPVCKAGYWLSFDNNLKKQAGEDNTRATFAAPEFYEEGQDTHAPTNPPLRKGYTIEGWYTDENMTTRYNFGTPLTSDLTLYAKWQASGNVKYRVNFWKQKTTDAVGLADDQKSYDYFAPISVEREAPAGSSVSIQTIDTQRASNMTDNIVKETNEDWHFFTYNAANSDKDSVLVKGDGTTVLNVYYDRKPVTFNFYGSDGNYYIDDYEDLSNGAGGGYYYYDDPYATGYWLIGYQNGPFKTLDVSEGTMVYSYDDMRKDDLNDSTYNGNYFYFSVKNPDASNVYSRTDSKFTKSNGTLYHKHGYWLVDRQFAQFGYYENQSGTYEVGTGPDPSQGAQQVEIPGATHYKVYPSGYYLIGDPNGPLGDYRPADNSKVYFGKNPYRESINGSDKSGTVQHYLSWSNGSNLYEYTYSTYYDGDQWLDDWNHGLEDPYSTYTEWHGPFSSETKHYLYNYHWDSAGYLFAFARPDGTSDHRYRPVYYKYDNGNHSTTTVTYAEAGPGTPPATHKHNVSSYTGLYGSAFNDWPVLGSGNAWSNGKSGNDKITCPLPVKQFMPQFDDSDYNNYTDKFYVSSYSGQYDLVALGQNTNGTYSPSVELSDDCHWQGGFWMPTETYEGFTVEGYRFGSQSGTWHSITPTGQTTTSESNLYLYYARNQHHFIMVSDGEEYMNEYLYYEIPLNTYGTSDNEPTNGPAGTYFDGWYADPGFETPFNFNVTMPDHDVRVYAKWTDMRFRVLLDPTGGDPSIADDIHFPGNQVTSFRLYYGEKIEKNAIQAATRGNPDDIKQYQLVGWYSDPEFQHPFNFDFSAWDQIADFNYDSAPDSERQGTDRWNNGTPWTDVGEDDVVGKITLYAKWRQLMNPDDFIMVKYDGNGGDNAPLDDTAYYSDMSQAIAQPATTKAGEHFRAWLILDKNGNPTGEEVRPGGTFNVEFDNAVQNPDNEHEFDVWLKADYSAPAGAVEIPWFANYEGAQVETTYAQPFAATNVKAAPERSGYSFKGWARVDKPDTYDVRNYTENDIWMAWDGSQYKVDNQVVEQIYSDIDVAHNQALYAVWEKNESHTYVIDFAAPMKVAEQADKIKGATNNVLQGSNGKFVKTGTDVTYQLDTQQLSSKNAQINKAYSGVDEATVHGVLMNVPNDKLGWKEITTIPASNIYFDDDLLRESVSIDAGEGFGQNDDITGTAADTNSTGAVRVDVDASGNTAKQTYNFTFHGTGIDIYCTTDSNGGYVTAGIFKQEQNGDWTLISEKTQTIRNYSAEPHYNVPTVSFLNVGEYGTYKVKLNALKNSQYKLDGVRVYGAMANQETVYTNNDAADHANAAFESLRTLLLNDASKDFGPLVDMTNRTGILYLDSVSTTTDENGNTIPWAYEAARDVYTENSPKNEIYLKQGQGIAFTVKDYNASMKVFVGMSVASASTTVSYTYVNQATGTQVLTPTISSTVDQYIEIKPDASGHVEIANTGAGILALTNIQVSGMESRPVIKTDITGNVDIDAQALSVAETPAEEPVVVELVVNEETMRYAATFMSLPAADGTQTDDTTTDPLPNIGELVKQLISQFVTHLFQSISRLFGN